MPGPGVRIRGEIARVEGGGAGGLGIRDFFGAGLPYAHVHRDTKKTRCPVFQIKNRVIEGREWGIDTEKDAVVMK